MRVITEGTAKPPNTDFLDETVDEPIQLVQSRVDFGDKYTLMALGLPNILTAFLVISLLKLTILYSSYSGCDQYM